MNHVLFVYTATRLTAFTPVSIPRGVSDFNAYNQSETVEIVNRKVYMKHEEGEASLKLIKNTMATLPT